jgi:conjugative relaxase-like TrwC/TraI family protein
VLSIAKVRRGGERYYLDAVAGGAEDHRRPGLEPEGEWLGRAAAALGLRGRVGGAELAAVLAGAEPSSGEVLNQAQDRVRVAGFDLVFAAPKSVSLCFALGDAAAAEEVRLAHEAAVAAAVGYLEREAITARRGTGEQRCQVDVDGVVGAAFLHRTSRAPDPHLHTHVLVANLVEGSDGRWSAFDARGLYAQARTAGYLYQAHLRHEMSRRLGLEWGTMRTGMADVGIDRSVILTFSRRSREIRARLAVEGRSGAKAARVAQLATRRPKDLDTSFESLLGEWRARAAAAGLGRDQLATLMSDPGQLRPADRQLPTDDWISRIVGPDGLTASASTFARRDVIRACCSSLPNGADVATVEALADEVLGSHLVQPASVRSHELRWTTPEVVAAERSLVEHGLRRADAGVGAAEPDAVESALRARPQMAPAQGAAVREAAVSRAAVLVATGATWAGATDAIDAARDAWQASGLRVQATASSAQRAADLEATTGIETTSLASVLSGVVPPADVLVVHDAGRLGARPLNTVLDGAERAGTKVVLVGEVRQLRAAEGGAFRHLGETLGSIALDAPRSTSAPERAPHRGWVDVVERASEGAGVVVGSSAPVVRQRLVADWWAARESGRAVAMVATSRRDREALNAGARAELAAAGRLGESMTVGRRQMAVGDDVLVGRGGRGAGVPTGTRAKVVGLDAERRVLELRTEHGRALSMGAATAVGAELRHGYATTPREARRARPDLALVLGEGGAARASGGTDRCYVVDGVGRNGRPAPYESMAGPASSSSSALSSLRHLGRRLDGLEVRLARAVAPDPTALLAHLDQEQARTAARLQAARSARSDSAARLDDLGTRRPWTRWRAVRQDTQHTRAELGHRESEVRRWEARLELLGERRRQLDEQGAARAAGLASRRPDLDRHQVLVHAVNRRERVLARVAEVSPPGYLARELGPRPSAPADRAAWREAARVVESYRERWGVGDPDRALGARGDQSARATSLEQRRQRDAAARVLDAAQRRLDPGRATGRSLEQRHELEPASRTGVGRAG